MNESTPEVVSVDGEEFYQWRVVLRIPKNWTPESGVFIAVAPPGGIANFPAAVKGEHGLPATFRDISVVELEYEDPTAASVVYTEIVPGSETAGPVYDVEFTLHRGAPGVAAPTAMLDATDLTGTPTAGYVFQVNAAGDGVDLVAQKVGNTYWPAAVTVLSNATGANALAQVTVPPQPFKSRMRVVGQVELAPDGPDVQVDLVARLGGTGTGSGSTDGLVIARGLGLAGGARQILSFAPAPPVNSSIGFGEVPANMGGGTTVYIRAEQVGSGTDTFDTISGRALFAVVVEPVL